MSLYHAYTQTVADGTATSVVRPSDWNSAHVQQWALSGNTSGASTVSGADVVLVGGNNVTVSGDTAGSKIVWSVGNYLTTAMQSNASTQFVQANAAFAGTNATGTIASNGISVSVNPQSVQTQASGAIAGTGFTSTTTAGTAITAALGTNGLTMAVPAYLTTYAQSVQTQASGDIAGIGFTTTTTAGTAVVGTNSTNGLSLGIPAYLTTYAAQTNQTQASGGIAGTGFTSTTTAGTAITAALGTNGLSMAVPAYLTTYAAQTNQTQASGGIAGTGFTSTTTAGTAITAALGTNGLTMAVPQFLTTQSNQAFSAAGGSSAFQTLGFSDNAYGSWTNTNGSVALTELRGSFFAVSNTTQATSGTQNLDAVSFAGAGGVSVGVSNGSVVISGGAAGTVNQTGPNIGVSNLGETAGATGTVSTGNVVFAGTNGILLSQSIGAGGTDATISLQPDHISAWANNLYMPNSATIQPRQSTSTIWPNMINNPVSFDHVRFPMSMSLQSSSTSTTNNSTFTLAAVTYTFNFGIYATGSSNATSLTSVMTTSASMYHQIAVSMSNPASVWTIQNILVYPRNTAGSYVTTTIADATSSGTLNVRTTQMTGFTGMRHFELPWGSSIAPNMYWMMFGASSTLSTNVNANFSTALVANSNWGMSQPNNTWGFMGQNTASSIQAISGVGSFTTAGGGTVTGLGFSNISSASSHIVPYVYMEYDG